MPFQIIYGDITTIKVDAIVNSANPKPIIGGGVDDAIHKAAGPELLLARQQQGDIITGESILTPGFNLPSSFVIHTVGPVWKGGYHQEEDLLRRTYQSCLQWTISHSLESIAFPLISAGVYNYPPAQAIKVAISTIQEFLKKHDKWVYLVLYEKGMPLVSQVKKNQILRFIDEHENKKIEPIHYANIMKDVINADIVKDQKIKSSISPRDLTDLDLQMEETFSESLLRLIDENGYSDTYVYRRANIDRKHFSKIRSNKEYQPSKATVFAFAIALKLNLDETKDLLIKAGYALSSSLRLDLIMYFCIENKISDIFEVNTILYSFDQPLLGSNNHRE